MTGALIEATLELLASSLREMKGRKRGLFTQERVAASANLFLDGLLGNERRKTGWMRAEAAGDPGPWRQQAIRDRGRWNADGPRDIVRDMLSKTSPQTMRSWSSMRSASSSRARHPAASRVNIPVRLVSNELPHRCIRRLCVCSQPCLYRSGFVLAQELDRRSRSAYRGPCA